ncbi:NACHT, LRR and PYD domains-containing protein 3-like isoform X1 [Patiria miniata]|uniref:NACHT domain-containing protein n=1 Tax=Patiria miniata TaxID=46514 RepID=A0A913ZNR4_PATMI|nr:NACHT, LRR and PYD domains-containing protein 3-like isoform X1 [Patiria miniata]
MMGNLLRRLWKSGPSGGFAPRTDLTNIQQLVLEYNNDQTCTIPAHPLDPSRTLDIYHFSELELTQNVESNETTKELIHLPEGTRDLDKPRTKPLYSFEDMLDVLVTKLRVILSGRAGFGKSTLLLSVANASTDPNSNMAKFKLVFPLKLSQMKKTSCVLEAIRDQILPGIEKAVLKKVIDDYEADTAFLLDGLDEIPSHVLNSPAPEGGYGVKDILHNKVLRRSTVLVSTRPHMIDFAIKGYPHYTRLQTLGFTLDTAQKYITSYFATKCDAKNGELLISHVTSSSLMRTLAQIPILVLFLCIIWDNLSKLPDQLTALYTQFADVLVSRRCNEGEDQVALVKSVVRGLGPVALDGLLDPKGERLVFSSEEFEEKALKDGCRFGFLQQESFTSGLKKMK